MVQCSEKYEIISNEHDPYDKCNYYSVIGYLYSIETDLFI